MAANSSRERAPSWLASASRCGYLREWRLQAECPLRGRIPRSKISAADASPAQPSWVPAPCTEGEAGAQLVRAYDLHAGRNPWCAREAPPLAEFCGILKPTWESHIHMGKLHGKATWEDGFPLSLGGPLAGTKRGAQPASSQHEAQQIQ